MSLLVKGARGKRKKSSTRLQAFEPLLVSWFGRGELKTAKNIEHLDGSAPLAGNDLMIGMYVNELLYYLLGKHEVLPSLFSDYHHVIGCLGQQGFSESLLREFEISLLSALGYGLCFDIDMATSKAVTTDRLYSFSPDGGFIETGVSETMATTYAGDQLLKIAHGDFSSTETLRVAKKLLRKAISFRLGDRQLKSRHLFLDKT